MIGKASLVLGFLLAANGLASFSSPGGAQTLASGDLPTESDTIYSFYDKQQIVYGKISRNNTQIPAEVTGTSRHSIETNWESDIKELTSDASFFRMVVDAPSEGEYTYKIGTWNTNSLAQVRIYVNCSTNFQDVTLSNAKNDTDYISWDDATIKLSQGKNVIVTQFPKWGQFVSFSLPSTLTIAEFPSGQSGVYSGTDLHFAETHIQNLSTSIWEADKALPYDYLLYNTDSAYESAVYVDFTAASETKSLDLTLAVDKETTSETAQLALKVNDTTEINVDIGKDHTTGVAFDVNIPSYQLSSAGFKPGELTSLRISNDDQNQEVRVLAVKESTQETADPNDFATIQAKDLKDKVSIRGRTLASENEIPIDWSASGLDFIYNGGGSLGMTLNITSNQNKTRFAVKIDGEVHYVDAAPTTILAENLEQGTHEVSIYKTSEAQGNLMTITSLLVDSSNTNAANSIFKPTESKKLKFEFIGDSITAANQIARNTEDAYQGYARRLADAYDADFDILAVSGRGLMAGYNAESGNTVSKENQMKDIWTKQDYFRDSSAERSNEAPDVVVVNLGNNDLDSNVMSSASISVSDFTTATTTFANTLKTAYSGAKIVFTYGAYIHRNYIDEFKQAIEGLNDEDIAFVELPLLMQGENGHPNDMNHDRIASLLSEKISSMLNVEDPYVQELPYTLYEAEYATKKGGTYKLAEDGVYWSGMAYIGDMGYDNNNVNYPDSVDEIYDDMSNVSYLKFDVTAEESATYQVRIGYATSVASTVGLKIDQHEFTELPMPSTNDWAGGHGDYTSFDTTLAAGSHSIVLTSALNNGGWLNYDYIALVRVGPADTKGVTVSSGEGYTVEGLGDEIVVGDTARFRVVLDAEYNKSQVVVTANGETLTPDEDGYYVISDVQNDLDIQVSGVTKNSWNAYFYDVEDGTLIGTTTNVVGGEIALPTETPIREGYTFQGWDVTFDSMPNSDINVYAIWEPVSVEEPDDEPDVDDGEDQPSEDEPAEEDPSTGEPGNDNKAAIIGGSVAGGVVVLGGAGTGLYFLLRKRR